MARIDTSLSAFPSGAGRTLDVTWPDPAQGYTSLNARARIAGASSSFIGLGSSAAGGGVINSDIYLGVACTLVRCFVGTDIKTVIWSPVQVCEVRSTPGVYPKLGYDPLLVQRWLMTLAFPQQSASTNNGDMGMEWVFANDSGSILQGAANGFGLQAVGPNRMDWIVRGGNGLVRQTVTVAPFDVTVFHQYEVRVTNQYGENDAQVQLFIDGLPVTLAADNAVWNNTTTNLPPNTFNGGSFGFRPVLMNRSQGAADNSLAVQQMQYIAAPSLQDTL